MTNLELVKYVAEARARGLFDDAIRQELLKAGWSEKDINEVLLPRTTRFSPIIIGATIVLGTVIVGGASLYMLIGTDGIKNIFSQKQRAPLEIEMVLPTNDELLKENNSPSANTDDTVNVIIPSSPAPDNKPANTNITPTPAEEKSSNCELISDFGKQIGCFETQLLKTGNSAICAEVNNPEIKNGCYLVAAAVKNSYPECKKVNKEEQVACILFVAAENGDSATCDKFNDPDNLRETCYHYIQNPNESFLVDISLLGKALDTKNVSVCYNIKYSAIRQSCLEDVRN